MILSLRLACAPIRMHHPAARVAIRTAQKRHNIPYTILSTIKRSPRRLLGEGQVVKGDVGFRRRLLCRVGGGDGFRKLRQLISIPQSYQTANLTKIPETAKTKDPYF